MIFSQQGSFFPVTDRMDFSSFVSMSPFLRSFESTRSMNNIPINFSVGFHNSVMVYASVNQWDEMATK